MEEERFLSDTERTEEVQHIIERMPIKFGFWVSIIVLFIFACLLTFGWIIRYPDIVNGQIAINSNTSPLKLIANSSGKLRLNGLKNLGSVEEGQMIGFLENPADIKTVVLIDSLLKGRNPNNNSIIDLDFILPKTVSLGELNPKYYSFISSLQQLRNYLTDDIYVEQGKSLNEILNEQHNSLKSLEKRIEMSRNTLNYVYKFYKRDSILFTKQVISEAELDKSQMSYITGKDAYQNAVNNLTNIKQQLQQTKGRIQEIRIVKPEKEKELRTAVISSYNELVDNIKSWDQRYVFRAPFDGKLQFLKFYNENQFIQSGEQVFTIIPEHQTAFGQMVLPALGSGKIKIGQEVIVKLENYPYMEYGSVSGKVSSISLTTSTTRTDKADMETYQVQVDFPNQLLTNYGAKLDFKFEARGSGEIITNDRRLIQRLFDNLKYILNK